MFVQPDEGLIQMIIFGEELFCILKTVLIKSIFCEAIDNLAVTNAVAL